MMISGQFYRKWRPESIPSGTSSSKKGPCKPSSSPPASHGFYLAYNLTLKMEARNVGLSLNYIMLQARRPYSFYCINDLFTKEPC